MDVLPLLQVSEVTKKYDATVVLDHVSFDVYRGEMIALLGVNGAGKTTAINLMLGLDVPSSGMVRLHGLDPRNPAARARVGATPQNVEFPEGIKTKEILEFVHKHYERPHPISFLVETFELGPFLHQRSGRLSGGQKRRLALALAFMGDPDLVFLDEPTTGLDAGSRRILWGFIKRQSQLGKTIFLTSHYLAEIEQVASRVLFLHNATVKLDGTVDELKRMALAASVQVIFTLDAPVDFSAFPHCVSFSYEDKVYTILTEQPEDFIRALVQHHVPFQNLHIERDNLESAFLRLLGTS